MGLAVMLATAAGAPPADRLAVCISPDLGARPSLMVPAYPDTYRYSTVSYDALSIANGERLFQRTVRQLLAVMRTATVKTVPRLCQKPPADLTAPRAADHTAGDRYGWITHGIPQSGMPPRY
ncbi:MAG: hypothetical protein U1F68_21355 [Gammaproteobacteria bacterium]